MKPLQRQQYLCLEVEFLYLYTTINQTIYKKNLHKDHLSKPEETNSHFVPRAECEDLRTQDRV